MIIENNIKELIIKFKGEIIMAAITEDYVSFEIARLLKEKGFDQNCATYYLDGQVWRHYHGEVIPKGKQIYAAPTQSMAMKWLREVHNIHIDICSNWDVAHWIYQVFVITPRTAHNSHVDKILYTSYKQAIEAGIKYCLENLI